MKKSNKATILGLLRGIADQVLDTGLPPSRVKGKYQQSQVQPNQTPGPGDTVVFAMPEWLAIEKEFV